jgi:hypothetical protein
MQLGSSKDSFPCFTRLNPCIAHCSTDLIPWVLTHKGRRVLWLRQGICPLANHMKFDTNIHRQHFRVSKPLYLSFYCLYFFFGHFPKLLLFRRYFLICFQSMFDVVYVDTLQVFSWLGEVSHLFSGEKPSASHMCARISLHTYDIRNEWNTINSI